MASVDFPVPPFWLAKLIVHTAFAFVATAQTRSESSNITTYPHSVSSTWSSKADEGIRQAGADLRTWQLIEAPHGSSGTSIPLRQFHLYVSLTRNTGCGSGHCDWSQRASFNQVWCNRAYSYSQSVTMASNVEAVCDLNRQIWIRGKRVKNSKDLRHAA